MLTPNTLVAGYLMTLPVTPFKTYDLSPETGRDFQPHYVGIIGSPVDRFAEGLLGKVLEMRQFGTGRPWVSRVATDTEALAIDILTKSPDRSSCRFFVALLSATDKDQSRQALLAQAKRWLEGLGVGRLYVHQELLL